MAKNLTNDIKKMIKIHEHSSQTKEEHHMSNVEFFKLLDHHVFE